MTSTFELRNITKTFGSFTANDAVSASFELGKIHAIVGENGAGKSTLMKIVNGLYQPDEGEMVLKGESFIFDNPADASQHGIGMVYQHFMLVPTLTVAENLILGNEEQRFGVLDMQTARRKVREVSARYGFEIDPDEKVGQLSLGKQQRVEIMKVLFRNASIIVFDEPSAVLAPLEIQELYAIMRQLQHNGATIIFITHKLQEVFDIADTVTVLRKGSVVGSFPIHAVTKEVVAARMIGRDMQKSSNEPAQQGNVVCRAEHVCVKNDQGIFAVDDVSFDIHAGEIFGIAGIDGNGQTELSYAFAGLIDFTGIIEIEGVSLTAMPIRQRKKLCAHIPENRHMHGAIERFSVEENCILGNHASYSHNGVMRRDAVQEFTRTLVAEHAIQVIDVKEPFAQLSGGNQQKCVVARELSEDVPFILAVHPTRGVDIGAIEMIYAELRKKASQGKAILLISSELGDITALSDRIAVMYKGRFNGIFSRDEATDETLGLAMTGTTR